LKKSLIIENDIDTLDLIAIILEDNEFEVVKSERKIPLQEIVDLRPDLIVIDYLLGDGLGDELCSEIKSNPSTKDIPVILCSASYKIEQLAHDSHADAFLAKPFDLDDFLQMIKEFAV